MPDFWDIKEGVAGVALAVLLYIAFVIDVVRLGFFKRD